MKRRPRSHAVWLVSLLAAGWVSGNPAGAEESARELAGRAAEHAKAGEYVQAMALLGKVVALKPDSKKYREELAEVTDAFLNSSVARAKAASLSEYESLVKLREYCRLFADSDPRTGIVAAEVESRRKAINAELDQAMAVAATGDAEAARALLANARLSPGLFPRLAAVSREVEYKVQVASSVKLLAEGQALSACKQGYAALAIKPLGDEAIAAVQSAASTLAAEAATLLATKKATENIRVLSKSIGALREIGAACPLATEGSALSKELESKYEAAFAPIWKQYQSAAGAAASWARCAIAIEAAKFVGPSKRADLDRVCDEVGQHRVPRIGLGASGGDSCLYPDWRARIRLSLPDAFEYVEISPEFGGRTNQEIDVAVLVEVGDCHYLAPTVASSRVLQSTFISGYDEISNPAYYHRLESAHNAERDLARLQALQAANPQDQSYTWRIIGAQTVLAIARNQLHKEKPFEVVPRVSPYELESATVVTGGVSKARVRLVDSANAGRRTEVPVEAIVRHEGEALRGAHPSDQSSYVNHEPSLPAETAIRAALRESLRAEIERAVYSKLPVYFAARASQEIAGQRPADAVGYLAHLRLLGAPEGETELRAFIEDRLDTFVVSAGEVQALSGDLELFDEQFDTPDTENQPRASGESVLESALEAVGLVRAADSLGTGFVISSDGFIVTNHHVIRGGGPIEFELPNGDSYLARLIASDAEADLALLRITVRGLPFLKLTKGEEARVGQEVFVLGNPEGLRGTVTKGIISARRRRGDVRVIQVDAPVNPGNSGGPLLLSDGRVVGVVSFIFRESEGLNFAIAIDEVIQRFPGKLNF